MKECALETANFSSISLRNIATENATTENGGNLKIRARKTRGTPRCPAYPDGNLMTRKFFVKIRMNARAAREKRLGNALNVVKLLRRARGDDDIHLRHMITRDDARLLLARRYGKMVA